MKRTVVLELPLPPKALHAHPKGNWRSKAGPTAKARQEARILASERRTRFKRARVSILFLWPDRRRRDLLNATQGMKPALDGIVDAGLIPDDDWKTLEIGTISADIDRTNPRVIITLEEICRTTG